MITPFDMALVCVTSRQRFDSADQSPNGAVLNAGQTLPTKLTRRAWAGGQEAYLGVKPPTGHGHLGQIVNPAADPNAAAA